MCNLRSYFDRGHVYCGKCPISRIKLALGAERLYFFHFVSSLFSLSGGGRWTALENKASIDVARSRDGPGAIDEALLAVCPRRAGNWAQYLTSAFRSSAFVNVADNVYCCSFCVLEILGFGPRWVAPSLFRSCVMQPRSALLAEQAVGCRSRFPSHSATHQFVLIFATPIMYKTAQTGEDKRRNDNAMVYLELFSTS